MKLGVSTLGCPDWTLTQILERVKAYGYDGVELRGLGANLDLTKAAEFATERARMQTRQAFADAGLDVCGVDTSAYFTSIEAAERAEQFESARVNIDLAAALGAPCVRVFGGAIKDGQSHAAADACLVENLRALGEYAARNATGVSIVLETHDSFSTGQSVAEILAQVEHPQVGALWDLHHPYRQAESPEETQRALGPYLRQTHVKDSQPGGEYCLLGEGDVPIRAMLRLLHAQGYDGYINLEWEKRWHPHLPEPETAFPQYAAVLHEYLSELQIFPAKRTETLP